MVSGSPATFVCHFYCRVSATFSSAQPSADRPLLLVRFASPRAAVGQRSGQMLKRWWLFAWSRATGRAAVDPAPSSQPGFTRCITQAVLLQAFPKIDLRSNIQNSQKNSSLNITLNACRIYGSVRHCSGSFYFKRDWANERRSPRKNTLQMLNPEASHK